MTADKNFFSRLLLNWYDRHRRDLPWRGETSAYRIWISETILQQTRVQQGMDYYRRFIAAFPDLRTLAEAGEDEVLKLWEGLGYYSRARNLHTAAVQVMEAGGTFPATFEEVKKLKGIGDYTAAAICSIAYGSAVAAVDGNAYRVLSRCFGLEEPIDETSGQKVVKQLAAELLDRRRPGDFNQAMMDLGATVCTPRGALCNDCPLQEKCVAWSEHKVTERPRKSRRVSLKERRLVYIFVRCGELLLMHRRNGRDIWRGLYEPLCYETQRPVEPEELEEDSFRQLVQLRGTTLRVLARNVRHVLTHRILLIDFYELLIPEKPALPDALLDQGYRWADAGETGSMAFPKPIEKMMAKI
jgi:A/G-specific adenine glycosylase